MTNEMKHTPGPWRSTGGCIVDSRNNVIAVRKSRSHLTKDTNTERGDYIAPTEADANAALIALAPALWNALAVVIYHYDKGHYGHPLAEAIERARKLL